jgi:tyrosyl-tRNA synthetase
LEIPPEIDHGALDALDLVMASGLATSRSDARRGFEAGEFSLNGRRVGANDQAGAGNLLHGRYLLVRRGKKRYALLESR